MPINVNYAPVQTIADTAYLEGQGQYNQQQLENALRQQQLQQQAAQRQQELLARLYGQERGIAANQQTQAFQAARQADVMGWQRQNQLDDQQRQHGWHLEDVSRADQRHLGDQRFAQQQQERGQQWGWENQSVGAVEQGIAKQLDYISDNLDLLPAKAQEKFHQEVLPLWQGIRNNRAIASNPKAYGEALAQFQAKANLDDIQGRMKPRLNNDEQFNDEVVHRPGMGYFSRDRSGAWRQVAPEKPDPLDDFVNKNLKNYQQSDGTVDMPAALLDFKAQHEFKEALKQGIAGGAMPAIAAAPRRITPKTAQNFDEYWGAIKPDEQKALRGEAFKILQADKHIAAPTTDEIMEKTRELVNATNSYRPSPAAQGTQAARRVTPKTATNVDEYWDTIDDDERRKWVTDALKYLPKKDGKGNPYVPSVGEVTSKAKELAKATRGFPSVAPELSRWESYKRKNPTEAAAMEAWAKQPQSAAQPVSDPAGQQAPAMPATPRHISEVPEAFREKFAAAMPQPKTPEEIAVLQPGTVWLAPDGSIREVP